VVEVRYFAAIADLAGRDNETLDLPAAATVGDLRAELSRRYGAEMARAVRVAAFLAGDELTRADADPLGARVDVLPPFAGG
jgi:molybdopterin converting factor small subunit